jgi:hypothetical protein
MWRFLFIVAVSSCLTSCTTIGPADTRQPSATFAPKRVYAVEQNAALQKMEKILDEARIPIASQNKSDSSARISTDYIAGPTALIAGGLVGAQSTRYRYHITVRPAESQKTSVLITCNVESTIKGGSGASQWTDVSNQNQKLTAIRENWLYEQFEKDL